MPCGVVVYGACSTCSSSCAPLAASASGFVSCSSCMSCFAFTRVHHIYVQLVPCALLAYVYAILNMFIAYGLPVCMAASSHHRSVLVTRLVICPAPISMCAPGLCGLVYGCLVQLYGVVLLHVRLCFFYSMYDLTSEAVPPVLPVSLLHLRLISALPTFYALRCHYVDCWFSCPH